jgi:hypothetical protein
MYGSEKKVRNSVNTLILSIFIFGYLIANDQAHLSESQVGEASPPDKPYNEDDDDDEGEGLLHGGEFTKEDGQRISTTG